MGFGVLEFRILGFGTCGFGSVALLGIVSLLYSLIGISQHSELASVIVFASPATLADSRLVHRSELTTYCGRLD